MFGAHNCWQHHTAARYRRCQRSSNLIPAQAHPLWHLVCFLLELSQLIQRQGCSPCSAWLLTLALSTLPYSVSIRPLRATEKELSSCTKMAVAALLSQSTSCGATDTQNTSVQHTLMLSSTACSASSRNVPEDTPTQARPCVFCTDDQGVKLPVVCRYLLREGLLPV